MRLSAKHSKNTSLDKINCQINQSSQKRQQFTPATVEVSFDKLHLGDWWGSSLRKRTCMCESWLVLMRYALQTDRGIALLKGNNLRGGNAQRGEDCGDYLMAAIKCSLLVIFDNLTEMPGSELTGLWSDWMGWAGRPYDQISSDQPIRPQISDHGLIDKDYLTMEYLIETIRAWPIWPRLSDHGLNDQGPSEQDYLTMDCLTMDCLTKTIWP